MSVVFRFYFFSILVFLLPENIMTKKLDDTSCWLRKIGSGKHVLLDKHIHTNTHLYQYLYQTRKEWMRLNRRMKGEGCSLERQS